MYICCGVVFSLAFPYSLLQYLTVLLCVDQNQPSSSLGQSTLGQNQSTLSLGQSTLGQNQSTLSLGQSTLGQNQSTLSLGQSTLGQNQSTLSLGQSTLGQNQSTLSLGQPNLNFGQSTSNQGQSILGQGLPFVGSGLPKTEPAGNPFSTTPTPFFPGAFDCMPVFHVWRTTGHNLCTEYPAYIHTIICYCNTHTSIEYWFVYIWTPSNQY